VLGVAMSALVQLTALRPISAAYDIRPMAMAIHQAQASGHAVAHFGFYNDQYHFAGRLQSPLHEVESNEELKAWLVDNPEGYAVVYPKDLQHLQGIPVIAAQRYLAEAVALLDAQSTREFLKLDSR